MPGRAQARGRLWLCEAQFQGIPSGRYRSQRPNRVFSPQLSWVSPLFHRMYEMQRTSRSSVRRMHRSAGFDCNACSAAVVGVADRRFYLESTNISPSKNKIRAAVDRQVFFPIQPNPHLREVALKVGPYGLKGARMLVPGAFEGFTQFLKARRDDVMIIITPGIGGDAPCCLIGL